MKSENKKLIVGLFLIIGTLGWLWVGSAFHINEVFFLVGYIIFFIGFFIWMNSLPQGKNKKLSPKEWFENTLYSLGMLLVIISVILLSILFGVLFDRIPSNNPLWIILGIIAIIMFMWGLSQDRANEIKELKQKIENLEKR